MNTRSPFLGATLVNTSPAVAEEMQVDFPADGVAVQAVDESSIAARVGLQKGDVILSVNGVPVPTTKDLERATRNSRNSWEVTINRNGEILTSVFGGLSRRRGRTHRRAVARPATRLRAGPGVDARCPTCSPPRAPGRSTAPRPLADRLRPQSLAEVAGQDHLIGPDGALTRLLRGGHASAR